MKRTNIYLDSLRHGAVVKESKKLGVSASEVIRGLIDEGLLQRDYDRRRLRDHDRKLTRNTLAASTTPVKHGVEVETHKLRPSRKKRIG